MRSRFGRTLLFLVSISASTASTAAMITDSTTFTAYSFTYDDAQWGPVRNAREADSFKQTLPVEQWGFGIFFLEPRVRLSSDGSDGPAQARLTGQIRLQAKPGFGLYDLNMTHSGDWMTRGGASVSTAGSSIEVSAPNGQFFYDVQQTTNEPLFTDGEDTYGYFFVSGEKSSFSRFDRMTIDYDLRYAVSAPGPDDLALLATDPSTLVEVRDYPQYYDIGTFVSASFERIAVVPEPSSFSLLACVALMTLSCRRLLARGRGPVQRSPLR